MLAPQYISISTSTMLKAVGIVAALWIASMIQEVLVMLFVAALFASILDPLVERLYTHSIPRAMSVLGIYLLVLIILSLVIGFIVPPVALQIRDLAYNLPQVAESLGSQFASPGWLNQFGSLDSVQEIIQKLEGALTQIGGGIVSGIVTLFGGLASFFIILVITFYLVTQRNAVQGFFTHIIPTRYQKSLFEMFTLFQDKAQRWVLGNLLLGLSIFIIMFIGLSILDVRYALVLALLAGLMEFIPYVGPLFAALPVIFIAFTQTLLTGLLTLILIVIAQQLQNHLIAPRVMQHTVGLNPVVSVIAVITGAKLGGFVGILLAIPVTLVISILMKNFFEEEKHTSPHTAG